MRRVNIKIAIFATLFLVGACADEATQTPSDLDRAAAYLRSAETRRELLAKSLVNPENGYSKRRLENYTETRWGALPVWNPRVRPVRTTDLGAGVPSPDDSWTTLEIDDRLEDGALRELGARAFKDYPNQVEPALISALSDADGPARFGLWTEGDRVGGLVWVELPDGVQPAFTCSSCHSATTDNGLVYGAPNHRFNYGALLDDHRGVPTSAGRWGPGRVDVTPDDIENPTVMADLRAVRFQHRLNRAATIRNDLMALVLRLETAIITATGEGVRPPRQMVVGLSWYLWSLGESLPLPGNGTGRDVFNRACAACHAFPGLGGPPVPLETVGTDPTVGESPWRTTGAYQTPSLRGVARRGRLMAGGDVDSLEACLDDAREAPGHRYGTRLSEVERAALLEFLHALE